MTTLLSRIWKPKTKALLYSLLLLITSLVAMSCATAATEDVPVWLSNYPSDPNYYIGIGGSHTGNMSTDREAAVAAARTDLAAQISAQVSSEIAILAEGVNDEFSSTSVSQSINQSVEQNLRAVETVATWFSPDSGAWAYLRLSKAEWAAIVEQEKRDLVARIRGILEPVADGSLSEAEALAALGRARAGLLDSPWGLSVSDDVLGGSGVLIDRVDGEISRRASGLSVQLSAISGFVQAGDQLVLNLRVSSPGSVPGPVPVLVRIGRFEEFNLVTENDGALGLVTPMGRELGSVRTTVELDLASFGIDPGVFPVTQAATDIQVEALPLILSVDTGIADELASLDGAVNDWITESGLPVTVRNGGTAPFELLFQWTISDFPRMENIANAPYITEVGVVIALRRNGGIIYTGEVEAYKDGGLNWEQAHLRAARGLLDSLEDEEDLVEGLFEALLE